MDNGECDLLRQLRCDHPSAPEAHGVGWLAAHSLALLTAKRCCPHDAVAMSSDAPTVLPAPAPDAPFLVLVNPGAGAHDFEGARAAIDAVMADAGREFELTRVRDPKRLVEMAHDCVRRAQARGGIVVAAGGDGTINAVAQAVLGSGCAFGVLPLGTFNYFCRTHGIPEDPVAAARLLVDGQLRPVQVGRVNERIFLVNASLGLYPQLLEDREQAKRQFGRSRLVAFGSGFKTLLGNHRVLRLRVRVDDFDDVIATPTLFVGNNRLQLEQIGIADAERVDHGQLIGIGLHPVSIAGMLWLVLCGSLGRLGDAGSVEIGSFRSLQVSVPGARRPRIKVATDGEIGWMRLPLRFAVADERLALLCPRPPEEQRAASIAEAHG